MAHEPLDRFLGWSQVQDLTGLGRTTAWRLRRTGDFPEPVAISPGRKAWRARDIIDWHRTRGAPESAAELRQRMPTPRSTLASLPPHATRTAVSPTPNDDGPPPALSLAPESAAPTPRTEPPTPITRPSRRVRSRVAEGQLGFDF